VTLFFFSNLYASSWGELALGKRGPRGMSIALSSCILLIALLPAPAALRAPAHDPRHPLPPPCFAAAPAFPRGKAACRRGTGPVTWRDVGVRTAKDGSLPRQATWRSRLDTAGDGSLPQRQRADRAARAVSARAHTHTIHECTCINPGTHTHTSNGLICIYT